MNQPRDITFQVNETTVKGYFATPSNPKAGIIVLHAWWGLTPFFKQLCDRLANEGFAAFAPDLRNGETAATIDEAKALLTKSDESAGGFVQSIVEASVAQIRMNANLIGDKLGIIGFSMGADWSLVLSTLRPDDIGAAVVFYGAYPIDFKSAQAAFQGHFAEHDDYVSLDDVHQTEAAIKSVGLSTDFHIYPNTGHWFFEDNRPDAYNAAAAQLAWERTLKFLRNKLS
jgi:carboxymethylenebutenolidase